MEEEEDIVEGKGKMVSKDNLEIVSAYFEIMAEFVSTKKVIHIFLFSVNIILRVELLNSFSRLCEMASQSDK